MALADDAAARSAPAARNGLAPVDRLLVGYVVIVSLVAVARLARFPECGWLLVANGLIVVLIILLSRATLGPFGQALRDVYPIVLLLALYGSLDLLNGGGRIEVHDATVQRWEAALFGGQLSREWWQAWPSRIWSTVFHAAYFSYYLVIAGPTVTFLARADRQPLRRFVLAVMASFVACYFCFIFFPVAGPYYTFPRPTGAITDNLAARLVYAVLAGGSSYGAAFPSSHVAASVAATIVTWAAARWLGTILAAATVLLTVGVVYCQMHYAVDAAAGILVGVGAGRLVRGER